METSTILSCTEANDAYTQFISKYTEVFNNCFPFRNRTKKHKTKKAVWYDAELRETYKSKQLLYKKYMRKRNESHKKNYSQITNVFDRLIKKKKQLHIKRILTENKNYLKVTWGVINKLSGKTKQIAKKSMIVNGFLISDDAEIANQFNRYFTSVAEDLVNNIPTTESYFKKYLSEPNVKLIFMKPTTPDEIQNIISTIKPKLSCRIENIPSKVIKYSPKTILKALSHVFNLSLAQGTFISSFKTAKVIPIYKKGDSKIIQNYRPVSLLSCFSKILEKVVYLRLNNFLD